MTERVDPGRLAVVVLAAGAGSRFSDAPGGKLLAELEGRPLLEHVLGAVRAFGPGSTVVVVGHGAQELERGIAWGGEVRVRNPQPERGLSSSLRVGLAALRGLSAPCDGAFIVLGDQPRLSVETMRSLAGAAASGARQGRPIVVPRYAERRLEPAERAEHVADPTADPGPRNPVLLLRPAWDLAADAEGDRGLAALIDERPELVLSVPVAGSIADVDTPADLARLRREGTLGGGPTPRAAS